MSCGTCGIQASETMQGDTGVPAGAPTTGPARCPYCQAFISAAGAPCANPRCPGQAVTVDLPPHLGGHLAYLPGPTLQGVQANLPPDVDLNALPPRQETIPLAAYVGRYLRLGEIADYKDLLARWQAGETLPDTDVDYLHQLAVRRYGGAGQATSAVELQERLALVQALSLVKQARGLPGFPDEAELRRTHSAALALRHSGALAGRAYLPGVIANLPAEQAPDAGWMLPAAGEMPLATTPLARDAGEVAEFNALMEGQFEAGQPMTDTDLDRLYGFAARRLGYALTKGEAGDFVAASELLRRWSGLQAVSMVRRARHLSGFINEGAALKRLSGVLRNRYAEQVRRLELEHAAAPDDEEGAEEGAEEFDEGDAPEATPPPPDQSRVAIYMTEDDPHANDYARPHVGLGQALQPLRGTEGGGTMWHLAYAQGGAHGLVLPGGGSVMPLYYAQGPLPLLRNINPPRDEAEVFAVQEAWAKGRPILGISRGMQVTAVAFGGALAQDISATVNGGEHHREGRHFVNIAPESQLAQTLGTTRLEVNSAHTQAVVQVPPGWKPVAWAEDGVIEAMEPEDPAAHPGCVCVQWNPARMPADDQGAARLYNWWHGQVDQARQRPPAPAAGPDQAADTTDFGVAEPSGFGSGASS